MPAAVAHPLANRHPLTNCQCDEASVSDKPIPRARLTAVVKALGRTLRIWRSRVRQRQRFPVIGERELRDLRMSRWDLERELAKPFWRG
jgi:uncharacterized protein YjiS (DUF1127 family)